ncbi:hypothetical protein LTR08_004306 [Meristemomyces frigidus]|nr:hypothetical protein LTR08_004306 [Meristemomyces frigidus]
MRPPSSVTPALLLLLLLAFAPRAPSAPTRGVNLGGWFVTEQWITPSLFAPTSTADEWSLCAALGKKKALSTLNHHWRTFFTRADFLAIRAAGLNAVRIPIGYWAVDVDRNEPYVSGQYPYLIRAVQWAAELGLTVLIDLHGAPGSQNGQDNSGLIGPVLFPSNASNTDRSLHVLRNLTREFSRHVYGGAVTGIEVLNEPRLSVADSADAAFSMAQLRDYYASAAAVVRDAGGRSSNSSSSDGTPLNVTIHDAFYGPAYWAAYNPPPTSDEDNDTATTAAPLTLDTHQYYAFAPLGNLSRPDILDAVCNLSRLLKQPQTSSGIPSTLVGKWSLQTGANNPSPSTSTSSSSSSPAHTNQAQRTWFRLLFEAQLAAYTPSGPGQASLGWFYWTWKTEYDIVSWSYRRGVQEGFIPADVGDAAGLVFPVRGDGCVDAGFAGYTAPLHTGGGGVARGRGVGGGVGVAVVAVAVGAWGLW